MILTLSLITTFFYFHPSTKPATSVFRTVTVMPETKGRVAETFVGINQRVKEGDPLFRLDSTEQEAAAETARRRIAEVEAAMVVAMSELKEADASIVQARGALQQAEDELEARAEANHLSPDSITVLMEPLYPGQLDDLPQGGSRIANAYTNNHEELQSPDISTLRWFTLHAIATVGLVHAMILRIQALLLPVKVLVFGGH